MALVNMPRALVILIVIIMIMITKSTSQSYQSRGYHCSNSTTYAANSSYSNNLNSLLHSLLTNATTSPTGFFSTSVGGGNNNNTVYGLFLCRGDQNTSQCGDCVATAVREQPQMNCPRSKVGIMWYNECMLRYDSQEIAGRLDQGNGITWLSPSDISGNQSLFMDLLGDTMHELAAQAANSPQQTGKKYANRAVNYTSFTPLYCMVQCTPDLSDNDCSQCLTNEISQLNNKSGVTIFEPSCILRYETYPFLDDIAAFNSSSSSVPASSSPSIPPTTNSDHGNKKVSTGVIVAIVVPVAVIAVTLLALGHCLILKKKSKRYDVVAVKTGEDISIVESLQYDLRTLELATSNFSSENKLGEGGFGGVYKGTLPNGQTIAVKKLSKSSSQGTQEFKNEVLLVAKLQHRNLVRLLGFCLNGEEKLLVYEYVANKSLDSFLFSPEMQGHLDWGRRYKIIEGIARGMLYLHQDSRLRIIHRDLKASNVLLDENMNPKISDFGMARIFGVDQTQGSTSRIVGTFGYMAPEYAMQGLFSIKSDVYSFGVLVLEIICGKKNTSYYQSNHGEDLFSNAWMLWRNGTPLDFVDATIKDACSIDEVMRCLHLALLCVQESVDARPTMATIVLALDSYSVTLSIPRQPMSFGRTESNFTNAIVSEHSTSKSSEHLSVNDVSITEFDPR